MDKSALAQVAEPVASAAALRLCPICRAAFDEFAPVSKTKARRAKCPSCGSVERHRFFWLLQEDPSFLPEGRMLHFAPEPWLIEAMRRRYGLGYLMADYELPPYDVRVDIQDIPFRDGFFDVVLCFGVLEHIPDDRRAMREIARVLGPAGKAFLHVPLQFDTYESWRTPLGKVARRRLYGQDNHLRFYGLDVVETLRASGFADVRMLKPSDRFSDAEMARFGLVDKSRMIVAAKAA